MSGTQTYAGLPQAAKGRGVGRIFRMALLTVLAVAILSAVPGLTFAAGAGQAEPCEAETIHTEWSAGGYIAGADESLAAVDLGTAVADLRFDVAVYGSMVQGRPADLLGRMTGETGDPGFYSILLEPSIPLRGGQAFYVVLSLHSKASTGGFFASPAAARADRQPFVTEGTKQAFTTRDGASFVRGPGAQVPFAVRVSPEAVQPEATAITRFVADPMITAGSAMNFTFSATGTTKDDPLTWTLKFGDGTADSTGSGASPIVDTKVSHTYAVAGNYTAVLTVIDTKDASTAQATLVITAAIPVTAAATPDCGLAPLNVCFTSTATNGTPPYTYAWNFADGQSSVEQNPCHSYVNAGTYTAILTVRDARGASGQADPITIRVSQPMIVTITTDVTDGIPPTVVNFCANVSRGLTPYTYSWDFGDGATATDQCPQHAYNEVGAYEVNLAVTDDCGQAVDAAPVTITVHESPWIRVTSPANGATVRGDVPLQVGIMVEPGVTIRRVDYYVDNIYLISITAPPWAATWISNGSHGSYSITAKVTDSRNRSTTSDPVQVNVDNPYLDGRVDAMDHPFRLRVYGLFFERGCAVKINGTQVPVTQRKGSNLVLAKGDNALKSLVPQGVPVLITVWNPDGGITQESTFIRY